MLTIKVCSKCNEEKLIAEFSRDKTKTDGFYSSCKKCAAVKNAAWRAANPEKEAATGAAYYAAHREEARARKIAWNLANPEKLKATTAAYNRAHRAERLAWIIAWRIANPEKARALDRAWYSANAVKIRVVKTAWRRANPDKVSATKVVWAKKNPEKVRAYSNRRRALKKGSGGVYTVEDIADILRQQRGRCANARDPKCKDPKLKGKRHIDHIVPLAKGGSNNRRNVQILCSGCNLRKGSRDPIEFAQSGGRLI